MTTETPVEVKQPLAQVSRDTEDDPKPGEVIQPVPGEGEVVELVELEDPEVTPKEEVDIEDELDPRERIAANHVKKNRAYTADDAPGADAGEQNNIDKIKSGDTIQPLDPEMVTIKVGGRELQVEKSKVDKLGGISHEHNVIAYQKQVAIGDGFQEVARHRRANEEWEKSLKARETRLETSPPAELPALDAQHGKDIPDPPTPGDQSIEQLARDYNTAILDGEVDEDEAAVKLANLVKQNQNSQTPIDIEAITQLAADEIESRLQVRKEKVAVQGLMEAYPELKGDPRLFIAVDNVSVQVEQDNPDWEPAQVLNEAYLRVAKGAKNPSSDDSMSQRELEKRTLGQPRVGTGRAVAPPIEPKKTKSDIVRETRISRGLDVD